MKRQLQSHKIIHRDIKEANIVVNLTASPIEVAIIDFGGSKIEGEEAPLAVTPFYCPPEFFNTGMFSKEGDIYSLGAVLSRVFGADEHPIKRKFQKLEEKEAKKTLSADPKKMSKHFKKRMKTVTELNEGIKVEAEHRKFTNLFNGIDDLSKEHRKK